MYKNVAAALTEQLCFVMEFRGVGEQLMAQGIGTRGAQFEPTSHGKSPFNYLCSPYKFIDLDLNT